MQLWSIQYTLDEYFMLLIDYAYSPKITPCIYFAPVNGPQCPGRQQSASLEKIIWF